MAIALATTIAGLRKASAALLAEKSRASGYEGTAGGAAGPARLPSLGLVPTMGALHAGHAGLAQAAVEHNDVVIASIFVNALQFGDPADLDRYPRTFEADMALLEAAGVDLVFAPSALEMYPGGEPLVRVAAGRLGQKYEGASRPGHFDGALTVVAKLLHVCQPAVGNYRAYFGQKDAQQLVLVRQMANDLNFPVEIVAVPTVRSAEGLALSSRNRFLSITERDASLVLSRALRLLRDRADQHIPLDPESVLEMIKSQPITQLDYLEIVDPQTLEPRAENCRETPFTGEALALVAARVGPVRLIDSMPLGY
ncbi:pantoate--beta-alanine ligase [Paeniglutamicibacter antarcticus]|uniref:Pantothenate synthetase n=1 Tax=Arthrobacter terrae TaxID=2935737 RepID=A0A931CPR8_9MICC|nr:pantoate--beta-alanine ligase [Arthrobacter terrae]MBG0739881.1 pantoate--beta-alanine ligase [Arthrobacter terrae]